MENSINFFFFFETVPNHATNNSNLRTEALLLDELSLKFIKSRHCFFLPLNHWLALAKMRGTSATKPYLTFIQTCLFASHCVSSASCIRRKRVIRKFHGRLSSLCLFRTFQKFHKLEIISSLQLRMMEGNIS